MQAIWIEVENNANAPYWLLTSGLDPNYFASVEAAHAFHTASADANQALNERFRRLQFRTPVMQNSTGSGFLLVNRDEGIKAVDVDLVTRGDAKNYARKKPRTLLDPQASLRHRIHGPAGEGALSKQAGEMQSTVGDITCGSLTSNSP